MKDGGENDQNFEHKISCTKNSRKNSNKHISIYLNPFT